MKTSRVNSVLRAAVALVYFHVNVAWGAGASGPLAPSLGESFAKTFTAAARLFSAPAKKPAARPFIFREYDDWDTPKAPEKDRGSDVDRVEKSAKDEKADKPDTGAKADKVVGDDVAGKGLPVKNTDDMKGPVADKVKSEIIPDRAGPDAKSKDTAGMRLSDVQISKLPVSDNVKAVLNKAVADGNPHVQIRADGGNVVLNIAGVGSVKFTQDGGGKLQAAVTQKIADSAKAIDAKPADAAKPAPADKAVPAKPADKPGDAAKPAAESKGDGKPVDPVRTPTSGAASLSGLGYRGSLTGVKVTENKGVWVTKTDPKTGEKTRTFEGTVSWETKSGVKYTATGTADGKVQLTREATGTYNGKDVSKDGKVTEVEFANGRAVAATSMPVGTTETRVNGELTHFDASNGPILREVAQPQGGAKKAGGDEAKPKELTGSKGQYVIRESGMDSVFKMVGGQVQLQQIKDAKTGDVLVSKQKDGTLAGNLGGKPVRMEVLSGPKFDANTGQAQLNVNIIASKGETHVLEVQKPGAAKGGGQPQPGESGSKDNGQKYDKVSFKDLGNGKLEVTALRNDARMAGTLSLGSGKTQLVQSSNISRSTFVDAGGNTVGRTLDGIKVTTAEGKASERPLISLKTNDPKTAQAFAAAGIQNTAPAVIPAGVEKASGTIELGGDGRIKTADVKMTLPGGATADLSVKDNKFIMTVSAANDTKVDLGAAVLNVAGGTKEAKVDLDNVFSDKPAPPAGVTYTTKVTPEAKPVATLKDIGSNLDAKVKSSDIKAWVNPLTGNVNMSQNGKMEVEGPGYKGTITVKDGKASELTFTETGTDNPVLAFTGADGKQTTITVPALRPQNEGVTLNLQTGQFQTKNPADLPKFLDGVKVQQANGLSFTYQKDDKVPGGLGVKLGDTPFTAVGGAEIKADQIAGARVNDGKVVIDLKPGAGIVINGPITVAKGREATGDGTVNNATIRRLEVGVLGGMTGIGTSKLNEGQKVFVAGGGAGGSGPDLSGLATKNVTIERAEGGQLVTGKKGGEVAVTVQETGEKGKFEGAVHLSTPQLENVTVKAGAEKMNVAGVEVTGTVTINKSNDRTMSFTADTADATVATPGAKSSFSFTAVGQKVEFVDGKLQNNAALGGVKANIDGVELQFTKDPKDANKVVGTLTKAETTLFGQAFTIPNNADGKLPTASLENGQLKVHFDRPTLVGGLWKNGTVDAAGKKFDAGLMNVHTLSIDVFSGRKSAEGSIDLGKDKSITGVGQAVAPAGAKPDPKAAGEKPADKPTQPSTEAAKVTGSKNLTVEDSYNEDGSRATDAEGKPLITITGNDWGAKVNGVLTEGERKPDGTMGASTFSANPLSDWASGIKVGENGYTAMNKTYSEGATFETREMSQGNFKVTFGAGGGFVDNNSGVEGDEKSKFTVTTETGGTLSYQNGQLVEKAGFGMGEGGSLHLGSEKKELQSTGDFVGKGVLRVPEGLAGNPAFTKDGDRSGAVEVRIKDGRLQGITGGTVFTNTSGTTQVIKDGNGPGKDLKVSAGTTFSFVGLDFLPNKPVTNVSGGTVAQVEKLDSAALPDSLKSRADLKPEVTRTITFEDGNDASVRIDTTVEINGARRNFTGAGAGSGITEIETTKSYYGSLDRSRGPDGQDTLYVRKTENGWRSTKTNIFGVTGASTDFVFKGVHYDISYKANDKGVYIGTLKFDGGYDGKYSEKSGLHTKIGEHVDIVSNSGELISGKLVGYMVNADGSKDTTRFFVSAAAEGNSSVTFAGDGSARLEKTGSVLYSNLGNGFVDESQYVVTGDDGKSVTFLQSEHSYEKPGSRQAGDIRFDKRTLDAGGNADVTVNGNVIRFRTDENGKEMVSTELKGKEGSGALAIVTSRRPGSGEGIQVGTVHYLEAGSGTKLYAPGGASNERADLSGKAVLAQTGVDNKGKPVTSYLVTSDTNVGRFTIKADSRLVSDGKGTVTIAFGHVSVGDAPGQSLNIGTRGPDGANDNINVFNPNPGQKRDPNKEGGVPPPATPSERLVFNYEGDNLNVKRGELVIQNGGIYVKPGSVLINTDARPKFKPGGMFSEGTVETDPNYMRQVQGDGSYRYVVQTLKSSNDDRAKDIEEKAKNFRAGRGGIATGADGKSVEIVVMDGSLTAIGSVSTSVKKESNWIGISKGTEVIETGQIVLKSQDRKDYESGGTTYLHLDGYRTGKDGTLVKASGETTIGVNLLKGQTVRPNALAKDPKDRNNGAMTFAAGGKLEVTKFNWYDGEVSGSATFTGIDQSGNIQTLDLTKAYNYFVAGEGAGTLSEEKLKQAKENFSGYLDTLQKMAGGEKISYMGENQLQSAAVSRQISVFTNYSAPELKTFTGVKDFVQLVWITPTVYADMIMGTDHAGAMLEGKEETPIGTLGALGVGVKMRAESLKDSDRWNAMVDNLVATGDLGKAMQSHTAENSWSGNFWRQLDKGAGNLLGFNRIMELDWSKVQNSQGGWDTAKEFGRFAGHFAVCVGEQTLNFFSFGGGALLSGGAKGAVIATKAVQVAEAGAKVIQVANAAEKVTVAAKAYQVAAKTLQVGKAVLFNPVTNTTFQLYLRSKAADSVHKAIDTVTDKGITSKEGAGATWQAVKDVATSEIGLIAPALGALGGSTKLGKFVSAVTGFGAEAKALTTVKQAATVAAIGAGSAALDHYVNNRPGSVWNSVATGAASAVIGYAVFRALGGNLSAAKETTTVTREAGAATQAPSLLSRAGNYVATNFGSALRSIVVGAATNLSFQQMNGRIEQNGGYLKVALQGGLMGLLGAGVTKAASGWVQTANKTRDGRTWSEMFTAGQRAVLNDRVQGAANIFAFELVGNNLIGHATYALGLSKTDTPALFSLANVENAGKTALTIGALHPFFAYGRIGTTLKQGNFVGFINQAGAGLANRASANFGRAAAAETLLGRAGFALAGTLQKGASLVVNNIGMAANMKQFGVYEEVGKWAAESTGLVRATKADDSGKLFLADEKGGFLKDENGKKIEASTGDKIAVGLVETASFLSAPVAAAKSESEKKLDAKFADAAPKLSDLFSADGGASRRAGILQLANDVRSAAATGKDVEVKVREPGLFGSHVETLRLSSQEVKREGSGTTSEVKEAGESATRALLGDKAFGAALASKDPGTVDRVVFDGKGGAEAYASETAKPEVAVKFTTEGGAKAEATAGESKATVSGESVKTTGDVVTVEGKIAVEAKAADGSTRTETVDARIEISKDGTATVKTEGDRAAKGDDVVTLKITVGEGENAREFSVRATADEAAAGIKVADFAAGGFSAENVKSVEVSTSKLTEAKAAEIIDAASGLSGGVKPSDALVRAAGERIDIGTGGFAVKVDAGLHTAAIASYVPSLGKAGLRDVVSKAAEGKLPMVFGALAAERLVGGTLGNKVLSFVGLGPVKALGNGEQAKFNFSSALEAGLKPDLVAAAGRGENLTRNANGEVEVNLKPGSKLSDVLTPEAISKLPKEIQDLGTTSDGVRVVLGSAGEPAKIVFEGVKNPGELFKSGLPLSPGSESRAPPTDAFVAVEKAGVFGADAKVDVAVSVGAKGADMVEVRTAGDPAGPAVAFIEGGKRYSNLNAEQAGKVVAQEGKSPATSREAKVVEAQVAREGKGQIVVGENGVIEATAGSFSLKGAREYITQVVDAEAGAKAPAAKSDVPFNDPVKLADAATKEIADFSAETGFKGSNLVADNFAADRLTIAAGEKGLTGEGAAKEISAAADILESRGATREAGILRTVADRVKSGEARTAAAEAETNLKGEKVGKAEAAYDKATLEFAKNYVDQLSAGKAPEAIDKDSKTKELAATVLDTLGAKATVEATSKKIGELEGKLKSVGGKDREAILQAISNLKGTIASLGKAVDQADISAVEKVKALTPLSEAVAAKAGAKELDAQRVAEMRAEIKDIPAGPKRDAFQKLFDLAEAHVEKYDKLDTNERKQSLVQLDKAFSELRAAFPKSGDLKLLSPLFEGKKTKGEKFDVSLEARNKVVAEIFGKDKNVNNLNAAERLVFVLTVTEGFFATEKATTPDEVSSALSGAIDKKAKAGEPTDQQRFDNGKRAALLTQFLLGRAAGLEAGGGKTAIFPQAIAEFAMRRAANGDSKPFVAELVVFANGEVNQYVKRYQPLFKALGLEAVDGRTAPGDAKAAADLYRTKDGVTKVVVSDMNTRGFRQNDVEREPNSELAGLIRDNVKLKSADEVDAQVLSRMAFINSDGNLVATKETVNLTEDIGKAVYKALGITGENPLAQALKAEYKEGESAGYLDFNGSEVKGLDRGDFYTKAGDQVHVSDSLMAKIQSNLKEAGIKDVTTGEIVEFVRALSSVRNETSFGFTNEKKEGTSEEATEDSSFRPTHKKDGAFQIGQIDSSPIFNVAAVLIQRDVRAKNGDSKEAIDKDLSIGDIRLSKASASATLIQALQGGEGIHRFAATGTPEALEGIIQATLGIQLSQVYSSSRHDFTVVGSKSVKEAYANQGAETSRMTVDYLLADGAKAKADLAVEAIFASQQERGPDKKSAGILIGARNESDLKATFIAHLEKAAEVDGKSSEAAPFIERLKEASATGGIRDLVRTAKEILLTEKVPGFEGAKDAKTLVDHVARVDVADGNGGKKGATWPDGREELASGDLAPLTAKNKLIVYSTEEGLRGRDFKSEAGDNHVDAVFMGLEQMSSEGRLQAWKRVDRNRTSAVRIEIVETKTLQNRVEAAKNIDTALKTKFGRPEGLFGKLKEGADPASTRAEDFEGRDPALAAVLNKDAKDLTTKDLVDVAGAFTSLENLGQSSMFFIGEQVEAKLLKEPLGAWTAKETSKEGKAFLENLQIDVLENSDKKEVKNGTEYADPKTQAFNAFVGGADKAISYLTRVANSKSVSAEIRVEAVARIADIVSARDAIKGRLNDVNAETGRHDNKKQFSEAAFVNVGTDVRSSPASQVADAVVRLSDLLLPNTRTSTEAAGAAGAPTQVRVSKSAPTAEGGKSDAGFLAGVDVAKGSKGPAGGETRLLTYREQGLVSALKTFDAMPSSDKSAAAGALEALGLINSAEDDDRQMAVSLVQNLTGAGVAPENLDIPAVIQAAKDLSALAPAGTVTAADVVAVASSGDKREATALAVLKANGNLSPESAAESDNPVIAAAGNVALLTEGSREEHAGKVNRPEGSLLSSVLYYGGQIAGQFNSDSKALTKLGETTLADAATDILKTSDGKIDSKALAGRLTAMASLLVGATGAERDNIAKAASTLADVVVASPQSVQILSRVSFRDLVTAASSGDIAAAVRGLVESKDGSSLYQPITLPPAAKAAVQIGGLAAGVAVGLFGATLAATIGAPAVAAIAGAGLIATALTTDKGQADPISGQLQKVMPSWMPAGVTAAIPAIGAGAAAVAGLISPWPAVAAVAMAVGGALGRDQISEIPVIGTAWKAIRNFGKTDTPAMQAVGVLEAAKSDIETEKQALFAKDGKLQGLNDQLAKAPAEAKDQIFQKIQERKAEILTESPVEGLTLNRLTNKVNETVPEADRETVLGLAVKLHEGTDGDKADRANAIGVLQAVTGDVLQARQEAFSKDDTLKGLEAKLAAATTDDEKADLRQQIKDRKAEIIKANPDLQITREKLAEKAKEMGVAEEDVDKVVDLALELKGEDKKSDKTDDEESNLWNEMDLDDLMDVDQDFGDLNAIAAFEAENEGFGIEEIDENFPAESPTGLTANDVVRNFGGQNLTDDQISVMRTAARSENTLSSRLGVADTSESKAAEASARTKTAGNKVAPLAAAVQNNTLQTRVANLIAQALPGSAVAKAAADVAQEKSKALSTIAALFQMSGVAPKDAANFFAAVLKSPGVTKEVLAALDAAVPPGTETRGARALDANAAVRGILSNIYYSATRAGIASVQSDGTVAPQSDVALLAAVSNPVATSASLELASGWSDTAPLYQAAAVIAGPRAANLSITGGRAALSDVSALGDATPVATLTRQPFGVQADVSSEVRLEGAEKPALVRGTIEVRVGGETGVTILARPQSADVRLETRAPGASGWTALEGSRVPAGNQFRFVPATTEGQKFDDASVRVYLAPAVIAPKSETPKSDEDRSGGVKETPATEVLPAAETAPVLEPVGAMSLRALIVPVDGKAPATNPSEALGKANRLLDTPPTAVAPAGAVPTVAVVRDDKGAISAVFFFHAEDGKWHGVQQSGDSVVRTTSETDPDGAGVELYVQSGDVLAKVAPAAATVDKPVAAPGLLATLWNNFKLRWAAPVLLAVGITMGGPAKASTPDIAPVPAVQVQPGGLAPATVLREVAPVIGQPLTQNARVLNVSDEIQLSQPMTVQLPGESGRPQEVVLDKPAGVFKFAAVVAAAPEGEKMVALPVSRSADGAIHVLEGGRELVATHFEGAPVGGTPALAELATRLTAVPLDAANVLTEQPDVIQNVDSLLAPDSGFSGWMQDMKSGEQLVAVLDNPTVGPQVRQLYGLTISRLESGLGDKGSLADLTYADINSLVGNERAFMNFVKQLAGGTEIVSAPKVLYLPQLVYVNVSRELGGAALLLHGHENPEASAPDMREGVELAQFDEENGIQGANGIQAIGTWRPGQTPKVTIFSIDMMKSLTVKGIETLSPRIGRGDAQFQFLPQGGKELPAFFRLLPGWMQQFLIARGIVPGQGIRMFDLSKPGDRKAAEAVLDMTAQLLENKIDAGTARSVYRLAYGLATGQLTQADLNAFMKNEYRPNIDLEGLIKALSSQIQASSGLLAVGNAGRINEVPRAIESMMPHHFGAVTAMPAQDRGWYVNKMGQLELSIVSPKQARKEAAKLKAAMSDNGALTREMVKQLIRLTGAGTDGFLARLRATAAQAEGGFVIGSNVEAIINGRVAGATPEQQRSLQAKALAILLEPLAQGVIREMGITMENEALRETMQNVRVAVVEPSQMPANALGGLATYDEASNTFVLSVDPAAKPEEQLARLVALELHEIVHLFVDLEGHDVDETPLGSATLLEEMKVQEIATRVADSLGVKVVAMIGNALIYDRIAATENAQAVYLVYDEQVKAKANDLKAQVKNSNGLNSIVIIVNGDAEARAAAKLFVRSGVRLVRIETLAKMLPLSKMSRLETHAQLELGTFRIRLAVPDLQKILSKADADPNGFLALLRFIITPQGAAAPALELLMPLDSLGKLFERAITARNIAQTIARQA